MTSGVAAGWHAARTSVAIAANPERIVVPLTTRPARSLRPQQRTGKDVGRGLGRLLGDGLLHLQHLGRKFFILGLRKESVEPAALDDRAQGRSRDARRIGLTQGFRMN